MNSYCFQLKVDFVNNNLRIILFRYRGKYDSNLKDDVEGTEGFNFFINVFGKMGKKKEINHNCLNDYSIPEHAMKSTGYSYLINNAEIEDLTIDGCMHFYCFFRII